MLVVVGIWTAVEVRALIGALRMSGEGLARHLGVGLRTLRSWLAGNPVGAESAGLLDCALAQASDEVKARFALLASGYGGVAVVSEGLVIKEDPTNRADALKAIAGGLIGTAIAPLDALARVAGTRQRPFPVDDGALNALEQVTAGMQDAFNALPVGAVLGPARAHLDTTTALLNGSMTTAHRQRLSVIVGATSTLVGSLLRNAGLWADAQRHYAAAVALGRDADHAGVEARALGGLAQLYSNAWPEEAQAVTEYAEQATRVATSGPMDAKTRSWLAVELGRSKAALGDDDGLRTAIDAAHRALDRPGPHDIGGRFIGSYDHEVVESYLGEGLVLLGQTGPARAVLQPALEAYGGWPGWPIRATIALAETYVLDDEPEEACRLLDKALTAALDQGYGLGVALIRRIRARMPAQWSARPAVQQLDERLRSL